MHKIFDSIIHKYQKVDELYLLGYLWMCMRVFNCPFPQFIKLSSLCCSDEEPLKNLKEITSNLINIIRKCINKL